VTDNQPEKPSKEALLERLAACVVDMEQATAAVARLGLGADVVERNRAIAQTLRDAVASISGSRSIICTWCGETMPHNGGESREAAIAKMRTHDATCSFRSVWFSCTTGLWARSESRGAIDIMLERGRQTTAARYSAEHDDEHDRSELAVVAAELVLQGTGASLNGPECDCYRPDPWGLVKKHPDRRRQLVIAGALLAAEIDRLNRAADRAEAAKDATK
jgi:hypothetical protein